MAAEAGAGGFGGWFPLSDRLRPRGGGTGDRSGGRSREWAGLPCGRGEVSSSAAWRTCPTCVPALAEMKNIIKYNNNQTKYCFNYQVTCFICGWLAGLEKSATMKHEVCGVVEYVWWGVCV